MKAIFVSCLAALVLLSACPPASEPPPPPPPDSVAPPACPAERCMQGLAIVYDLNAYSEQEFQRLVDAKNLGYVLLQVGDFANHPGELRDNPSLRMLRERLVRLRQAGKKPVIQLFWGSVRWSWELYSLSNIALNERIREDFFKRLVGPLLEALGGQEAVHGIHLLEENGLQHGSDAQRQLSPDCGSLEAYSWEGHLACSSCLQQPVDPSGQTCSGACFARYSEVRVAGYYSEVPLEKKADYEQCVSSCIHVQCQAACQGQEKLHDGLMFRGHVDFNPRWFLQYNDPLRDDHLNMCNVKRHEEDFRRFTQSPAIPQGCTFEGNTHPRCMTHDLLNNVSLPRADARLVQRWIGDRLLAQADRELALFVHGHFPGVKVYSWPDAFTEDVHALAQQVDGFIIDPYSYEAAYRIGRLFKVVAPGKELLYLGGIPARNYTYTVEEKRSMVALGVLMGADGVGFFEAAHSFRDATLASAPNAWSDSLGVFQALSTIPVLQPRNEVLVVADYASALRSEAVSIDAFRSFDYVPVRYLKHLDLGKYKLVVLFNPDYSREGVCEGTSNCLAKGDPWTWDRGWMESNYPSLGANLDHERLDAYVRGGGLLAMIGYWPYGQERPAFTRDYFALYSEQWYAGPERRIERKLTPSPWAVQHFGLGASDSYLTYLRNSNVVPLGQWGAVSMLANPADAEDDTGGFHYNHGAGAVLVIPSVRFTTFSHCHTDPTLCPNSAPFLDTDYTQDHDFHGYLAGWRRYLRDTLFGLARHHGRSELEPLFNVKSWRDVAHYQQRFVLSPTGPVLDVASISYRPVEPVQLRGKELFTLTENPTFSLHKGGVLVQSDGP